MPGLLSDAGIRLYIPFLGVNTAQTAIDMSGNNHIATFIVTAQISTAEYKFPPSSLLLDGDSDYVSFPNSPHWDICGSATDNQTLSLFAKFADHADAAEYLIHQYESGNDFWQLYHTHGSGLKFRLFQGGGIVIDTGYGGEITDNNWHHIALCKVAANYGVYKDGTQVNHTNDSTTDTLTGPLLIGAYGAPSAYFDGNLGEVLVAQNNIFGAAPNAGLTDTIVVPPYPYSKIAETQVF